MNHVCFHCNEPVPTQSGFTRLFEGAMQHFCCAGCLGVASCIYDAGLEDYYQLREDCPDTPMTGQDDYSLYDKPAIFRAFSRPIGDAGWQSRLSISGMHCAACAWLIENHLQRLPGVHHVSVQLHNAVAIVDWDAAQTSPSQIMREIGRLGYQALPDSPSNRERQQRRETDAYLRRLGVAGIGMMQVGMVAIGLYAGDFQGIDAGSRDLLRYFSLAVAIPVIGYAAQPFFTGAVRGLRSFRPGMDVPVSLALLAAFGASVDATLRGGEHVYYDTVSMFTFFLLLSRYLQSRIRQYQSPARTLLPTAVRTITAPGDSDVVWLPLSEVRTGQLVHVGPGDTIPFDGIVRRGESSVETSAFTGEFKPRVVLPGEAVLAGSGNIDAGIDIEVTATENDSSLHALESLVDAAQNGKPRFAQLADKLASSFVLVVLALACASYVYWHARGAEQAFVIALSVLVVSCPCALSLATPTTFTASVAALRRRGILPTSSAVLERLQHFDTVLFDKTGTLTLGQPHISDSHWYTPALRDHAMAVAAALERHSQHPLARAFASADAAHLPELHNVIVHSGKGVEGWLGSEHYRIGSAAFCEEIADLPDTISTAHYSLSDSQVFLVCQHTAIARFSVGDQLRTDAAAVVAALKQRGLQVGILSGDHNVAVEDVAKQLGITDVTSGCSPHDKLAHITAMQRDGKRVMMVGDGVNDAPVLAAADIAVAMNRASDLTRLHADILLLSDKLWGIPQLLATAGSARRLLRQNIGWALLYNMLSLPAAAMGLIPPWLAAVGMSTSSLVVVGNALRIGRSHRPERHIVSVETGERLNCAN